MTALWPQLLFVLIGVAAAIAVVLKAPNGPQRPRRRRKGGRL